MLGKVISLILVTALILLSVIGGFMGGLAIKSQYKKYISKQLKTKKIILPDLPKINRGPDKRLTNLVLIKSAPGPIIKMVMGLDGCTGFVIDNTYAITAGHCVIEESTGELATEEIKIFDKEGKDTKIVAKPVCYVGRSDFGLIKGDFKSFNKLPIEANHYTLDKTKQYIQCGFPYGQKLLTCSKFIPITNDTFYIWGLGNLVPGQSGGPVIDLSTGKAVGLNSYVYGLRKTSRLGGVGISLLIGLPAACSIE